MRGPRGGLILCKKEYAAAIDRAIFPGIQGGPLMHIIAAKAIAFKEALQPEFKEYQKQIIKNAQALSQALKEKGFRIVSDGTDNHLILIDLTEQGLSGKDAENMLDQANVTANKNTIPFESKGPFVTSGIRVGTPASTTRGMKEEEMKEIAEIIALVLIENKPDQARERVKKLTDRLSLYGEI